MARLTPRLTPRLTLPVLVTRYAAFAALATLVNLGAQRVVLHFGAGPWVYGLAVIAGTGAGLVLKYALDKKWIFYDVTAGAKAQGGQFALYTAMGLITTAIFWASETAFWLAAHTHSARETGAVLGLAVGYGVKYRLDRRFVFTDAALGLRR